MGISNLFLVMHRDIERTLNITIFQDLIKEKGSLASIDRDGCRWSWSGVLMRLILDVFWAGALWIL
jgi:hypothetical protein